MKEKPSEESVIKEWENMIDSSGSQPGENQSSNKNEGFNFADNNIGQNNKGLKVLLDRALQSYEKLPMLEIVFDRLVRLLTTSLRNLTAETVDVDIITYDSLRFSSYIKTIPPTTLITVFKAIEWENLGLLTVDSSLVFSFVDILFGGKKNKGSVTVDGRVHTDIEQSLARQISDVILADLSTAFDVISPVTFSHDRMEINPTFATICRPGDAVMLLQLKVELESRGGKIELLIPYATLEPVKELLLKVFMGETFGTDAEWEESLLKLSYDIDIPLEAMIINKPSKIIDIANLKIGDTIVLEHEADEDIIVSCRDVKLYKGRIGKINKNVAISISDVLFSKPIVGNVSENYD